jgi:hypothetical protein
MAGTGSNVFGSGIGLADQLGITLTKQRVTAHMVHMANADASRGNSVGAAFRGELVLGEISPEEWIARECAVGEELSGLGLPTAFDPREVVRAANAGVTVHSRFLPGGLTLTALFPLLYAWNEKAGEDDILKLYGDRDNEWWRKNGSVQQLPTKAGVLTCNFLQVMQPTDLAGRPFYLNMEEQTAWAKAQGGSGLASAEQLVYLFIRSVVERQLPLWAVGSARCCNTYGSDYSLNVYWNAGDGFYVSYWARSDRDWYLGAVPEVFAELVP